MTPEGIKTSHWVRYNCQFVAEHFLGPRLFEKLLDNRRKKLYADIEAHLKSNGKIRGGFQDVAEVESKISLEEFMQKPFIPNKPTVFRKAAADWPAVKKWNLEFFEDNYGGLEIMINDNVGFIDRKNPQKFETMPLKEYMQLLKQGSKKYLKFSSLVHEDKRLQDDLDLNWLKKFMTKSSFGIRFFLFIGGKDTLTPVHDALPGTVFVQIYGKKKWTIFPTEDRVFMDVRAERRSYFHTAADPDTPDDPNFPLMKYVRKYEITMEPGDVLWMPPFLWHQVENPTDSIGVAFKFVDIPQAMKASKVLTSSFFLATKPTIFAAYWASLFQKVDYLFSRKQAEIDNKIY